MAERGETELKQLHSLNIRVYYEDVDLAGVVYYANYLRYYERGRTDSLRDLGVEQGDLLETDGAAFVVRRFCADYLAPARYDDLIEVLTGVEKIKGATLDMRQEIRRDGELLNRATLTVACMGRDGRPRRIPDRVRQVMEATVLTD